MRTLPIAPPRVKVLATGGTIANTPSGRLHAGEVAEAIPQLKSVARLDVEELMRVGSSAITVANWLALSKRINEILANQGSATIAVALHASKKMVGKRAGDAIEIAIVLGRKPGPVA